MQFSKISAVAHGEMDVRPALSRAARRCTRIFAAVDPDPDVPDADMLSTDILTLAARLARGERGRLGVVHAWQVYAEEMLRGGYRLSRDTLLAMGREIREALLSRVPLGDVPVRVYLVRGNPRANIPRTLRSHRADLVVMGTVGAGLAGLFIGNIAESVLAQVRSAVLAAEPRDFETPVTLER